MSKPSATKAIGAATPTALATRLAEVEKRLDTLLRVPRIRAELQEQERWELMRAAEERSEQRQRDEHRRRAPERQAAFAEFAASHLAVHASLTCEPVSAYRSYQQWCSEKRVPTMNDAEFRQAVCGLPGVSWSESAYCNSVGRMIPGFRGCAPSEDAAAEVAALDAEAERETRERLQRISAMEGEQASRDEAMEARRLRDEGLRVLARQEAKR